MPVVSILFAALWAIMHFGAYEHVQALGVWPDLTQAGYLGDATFLQGSALNFRSPRLICLSFILPIGGHLVRRPSPCLRSSRADFDSVAKKSRGRRAAAHQDGRRSVADEKEQTR